MEISKNKRGLSESEIIQYKTEGYIKNLPVFSEKGTEMTSQLLISKFEILCFSNKIHKNSAFLSLIRHTFFEHEIIRNIFVFIDLFEEILRISNFEMSSWDVNFVPFSEKVI